MKPEIVHFINIHKTRGVIFLHISYTQFFCLVEGVGDSM